MANRSQEEVTRLGLISLTPFVFSALVLWLSPWIVPQRMALDFHQIALAYGSVMVAYLAGVNTGGFLSSASKAPSSFFQSQMVMLAAFFAIMPSGVFSFSVGSAWRHILILILLIILLMRDLNAANAGALPRWYGALRIRLTFWAGASIILIFSRLFLWGFY